MRGLRLATNGHVYAACSLRSYFVIYRPSLWYRSLHRICRQRRQVLAFRKSGRTVGAAATASRSVMFGGRVLARLTAHYRRHGTH